MAATRVRVSSGRSVAGVTEAEIEAEIVAVAAVRKDAPTVAGIEVLTGVETEAETAAVGVSNVARVADHIADIKADTLHSAVHNSFPKCSRRGRT